MPVQIAFEWSKKCEKELIAKGFKKKEVYIKSFGDGKGSEEACENGNSDFFKMKHSPFQFITTSWWGAKPD